MEQEGGLGRTGSGPRGPEESSGVECVPRVAAPALAQADIGIAIGAGTDVAIEAAKIVLMRSDPLDIVNAIVLSKATVRKMKQNLVWASVYNVLAIPVAAGVFYHSWGWSLRPEVSALLMSASSIFVSVNAVMLRRSESRARKHTRRVTGLASIRSAQQCRCRRWGVRAVPAAVAKRCRRLWLSGSRTSFFWNEPRAAGLRLMNRVNKNMSFPSPRTSGRDPNVPARVSAMALRLASCALAVLALGAQPGYAQTTPRQTIGAFEDSLRHVPEARRGPLVRRFFAGLKDAGTKIEAIGLMDDRYVYLVPSGMDDELLGRLLRDRDVRVRARAARALGYRRLGGTHVAALTALLGSPNPAVRSDALYGMGQSGSAAYLTPLRKSLSDPDPNVRQDARFELAQILARQPAGTRALSSP